MNFIRKWILKSMGKEIGSELKLKEGNMDGTKKWWQSKTIWAQIVTLVISIIQVVKPEWLTTEIYLSIIAILQGIGIYGRVSADTTLTK